MQGDSPASNPEAGFWAFSHLTFTDDDLDNDVPLLERGVMDDDYYPSRPSNDAAGGKGETHISDLAADSLQPSMSLNDGAGVESNTRMADHAIDDGPSSVHPTDEPAPVSSTDIADHVTSGWSSSVHLINEPLPESNAGIANQVTPEWSSSVYSSDEDDDVKKSHGRHIYRVSSDDASSIYSNNEPGVAGSAGPWEDDDGIPRPVSPTLGIYDQAVAGGSAPANRHPTLGYYDIKSAQSQALMPTIDASQENRPANGLSRNTSFGSIVREACKEYHDSPASNAYPPAAHGRDAFMMSGALHARATAPSRQVSGNSASSSGTVINYSRKGHLFTAPAMSPHLPPNAPLPPPPDWKPVTRTRSPYVPLPPKRPAPAIPSEAAAKPAIPLRKRPSLTNEELNAVIKRADAAHESSVSTQLNAHSTTNNIRVDKSFQVSRTSSDFQLPDLVPQALRVRPKIHDETSFVPGGRQPAPKLASTSASQLDMAPPQAGVHGYGNEGQSLRQMDIDYENQVSHHDFSSSSEIESMPAHQNTHNARLAVQRAPTPAMFADADSPASRHTTSSGMTLWPQVNAYAPAGSVSFSTSKTYDEHSEREMQEDREVIVQASERLRAMGSRYFTQRAVRPSTSKDESADFGPGFGSVQSPSGTKLLREDHPALSSAPSTSPKGFKGKMQKVAEKLKLRKSSKNLRAEKKVAKKASKSSLGSLYNSAKSSKGRSTTSLAIIRQRSQAELVVPNEVPPVPAIPLRHRKTFA